MAKKAKSSKKSTKSSKKDNKRKLTRKDFVFNRTPLKTS